MVEVTVGRRLSEQWRGALPACCRHEPALACRLGGAGEGRGEAALVWRGGVGLEVERTGGVGGRARGKGVAAWEFGRRRKKGGEEKKKRKRKEKKEEKKKEK
jgi:hypothetical protein